MNRIFFWLLMFSCAQFALAALPPRYQNIDDLNVIIEYIQEHPRIASTLESINLTEFTVYFNNGCKAVFGRKWTLKPPGWVGPADPLEFKKSDCPVD